VPATGVKYGFCKGGRTGLKDLGGHIKGTKMLKALGRNKLAAELLAREFLLFHKQHFAPGVG